MPFDLGDIVPLTLNIKDTNGNAANATSVVLTITLPDGTTTTPGVTNSATGTYQVDYTATQAGLHIARWVASGTNAGAYVDSFTVDSIADVGLVSLAELKAHINTPATSGTTYDDELRSILSAATQVCSDYVQRPLVRATYVETYDGGQPSIILRQTPVISVTTVVESGTTLAASDYFLDAQGNLLWRGDPSATSWWVYGVSNVTVTYVAGWADPPQSLRMAVKRMAEHLWTRTQQAPHPAFGAQYGSAVGDETMPKTTYLLPYAVQSLLNPYRTSGF